MAKYFKIVINENDDTGVDFNSFVDVPAHMRGFISFGKELERYEFNEEQRTVTGCMIAVDMPIIRNTKDLGEHFVIFDAETTEKINFKFSKNNFGNNVNTMHDMAKATKGAIQTARFIASNSNDNLPNIPQVFENQKIKDGSLFCTYYVEDDTLWNDVKSGKFQGFSVEGWFDKKEVQVTTKNKHKMSKPSFWDKARELFSGEAPTETPEDKTTFTEATTADGVVIFYEGELEEKTVLQIEIEGEKVPAPEGEHELTLADGTVKIVSVDATGSVVTVQDAEAEAEENEAIVAFQKEFTKATDERFSALEKELKEAKEELSTWKEGDKFRNKDKATGDKTKLSATDLLKQAKKK